MAERTYEVVTTDHEVHTVVATMVIENANRGFEGGLVFRDGEKGSTQVVASFAPGSWLYYKAKYGQPVMSAIPPVEDRMVIEETKEAHGQRLADAARDREYC